MQFFINLQGSSEDWFCCSEYIHIFADRFQLHVFINGNVVTENYACLLYTSGKIMNGKIIKDALILFLITVIAGLGLGLSLIHI